MTEPTIASLQAEVVRLKRLYKTDPTIIDDCVGALCFYCEYYTDSLGQSGHVPDCPWLVETIARESNNE